MNLNSSNGNTVIADYATTEPLPSVVSNGLSLYNDSNPLVPLVVDGVTVELDSVILVKNQADPRQNGVYRVVQLLDSPIPFMLNRLPVQNIQTRMIVMVQHGLVNASSMWSLQVSPPGSLITEAVTDQVYQVFIPVGGGAPDLTFILRPGYTGDYVPGLYTNWEDLYAVMSQTSGMRTVLFDDTDGVPTITAGTWDLLHVKFQSQKCFGFGSLSTPVEVVIEDGAVLSNLCEICGSMRITYQGTTAAAITIDLNTNPNSLVALILRDNVTIRATGTQPFVRLVSGFYIVFMNMNVNINNGGTPVFVSNVSAIQLILEDFASVNNNTLGGTGDFLIVSIGAGNTFDRDQATAQPAVTGTVYVAFSADIVHTTNDNVDPTATDDTTLGYNLGDIWVNSTNDTSFVCVDNSTGAAVWNPVTSIHNSALNPTAADDTTLGYNLGDTWVNTSTDSGFICVDNTAAAAVWAPATQNLLVTVTATPTNALVNHLYAVDTAAIGGASIVNLQTAVGFPGETITVKDSTGAAGVNPISVVPAGVETIDGVAGANIIGANYGVLRLASDGANWMVI